VEDAAERDGKAISFYSARAKPRPVIAKDVAPAQQPVQNSRAELGVRRLISFQYRSASLLYELRRSCSLKLFQRGIYRIVVLE